MRLKSPGTEKTSVHPISTNLRARCLPKHAVDLMIGYTGGDDGVVAFDMPVVEILFEDDEDADLGEAAMLLDLLPEISGCEEEEATMLGLAAVAPGTKTETCLLNLGELAALRSAAFTSRLPLCDGLWAVFAFN